MKDIIIFYHVLSRIKIICQKVATENFKDLPFRVAGQR